MILNTSIAVFHHFEPQMLLWLVVLVMLFILSAGISGSETAFFSLSPSNIQEIRKKEKIADTYILRLLEHTDYLLATILIVNNLVNIGIVILSSNMIDQFVTFNSTGWELLFKTIIVTFLLLLFGEIMPKVYASYHPMQFARMMARPLIGLKHIFKPFSYILIRSGSVVNGKLFRNKAHISLDDLSDAIEITGDHTEEEKQMLSGIVNFVSREVSAIMKLRMDIVALDKTSTFDLVKEKIIESGFSRIPVYEDNIDTVIGVLYVKDMMPFISEPDDFNWQTHLRTPYFVPENKKINDLMEEFQTQKVHMAIVVDEYGATQGLVSLEDILEEIVGEITDESDSKEPTFYTKIDEQTYLFDGKTHLSDFTKVMGLDEDHFSDVDAVAETLAGLLLELKRDFLRKGESLVSGDLEFTVTSLDGRRIDKVKVKVERN